MKKITILFILTICNWGFAHAQDTIVTRKGEEIQAKVLEIGLDEIRYNRWDNQTGPIFSLSKADAFMIKYANGTRDIIKIAQKPEVSKTVRKVKGEGLKIDVMMDGKYYQNNMPISEMAVNRIIKASGNQEAINQMSAAYISSIVWKIVGVAGIPVTTVGAVWTTIFGVYYYDTYSMRSQDKELFAYTLTITAIGTSMLITSEVKKAQSRKQIAKAVALYNGGLQ